MTRPSRYDYQCTFDDFRRITANHQMTIVSDEPSGHRHLKFRATTTIGSWFDLITVPGLLVINGDYGCYAFSRITDMFEFFRAGERGIEINRGYWAEKCVSASREQITEFDADLLWSGLVYQLRESCAENRLARFAELRELIEDHRYLEMCEQEIYAALAQFQNGWPEMCELPCCHKSTYHFEWCLWAIVWGISVYDEHKAGPQAQAVAA